MLRLGEHVAMTGFFSTACWRFLALLSLSAAPQLSTAVPVSQRFDDLGGWFRTTTQTLMDAVTSGDRSVWDRALDADCIITTEDGELLRKARFLQQLKPLPAGFSGKITVRDLTVRTLGSTAVVHYWLDEQEQIFDQQLKTTYVETDVYRRSGASWQVVAMQVTVVPRDLEPIPQRAADWQQLVGDYQYSSAAASRYRVSLRDGALFAGRDDKTATRLIPLAPLVFFQQGSIHIMIFVRDETGAISEVRELHKYNEVRMKRVIVPPR
jgi:uncharacterized protein DUF4440